MVIKPTMNLYDSSFKQSLLTTSALSISKIAQQIDAQRSAKNPTDIFHAVRANQARSYDVVHSNIANGVALTRTADGALSQSTEALQRLRNLTLEAAGADPYAKAAIGQEMNSQLAQLDQIANSAVFGSRKLLDGSSTDLKFATGIYGQETTVSIPAATTTALGLDGLSASYAAGDTAASLKMIDAAIADVSASRVTLGSTQNRLEATDRSTAITAANIARTDPNSAVTLGAQIMTAALLAAQMRSATTIYSQISRLSIPPVEAMLRSKN